ncbi:hypothetical protein N8I77_002979 [Diaporthe amygdali]|uniref:DNA2/NAM7 helicase-like C-terminal domain-containing protein n=1 Tax=Phomopsis amygdali TaxID=1214568 RepID=A0AAD9SHX6_PHOAM|nr:hypothetical protein N8I77_002979 [Diaporthe amygdali]
MSPAMDGKSPADRSAESLWRLVQYQMIQIFNRANEEKLYNFSCWPVNFRGEKGQHCKWVVLVITNAHDVHPAAANKCHIRIEGCEWWEATRIQSPWSTILLRGNEVDNFVAYQVEVPLHRMNNKQPRFTPLELSRDGRSGTQRPVCKDATKLSANLHLVMKFTPQLTDHVERKHMPDAPWKIEDAKQYLDIYRHGTEQEFRFEAKEILDFNHQSVYQCWLIMCDPSDGELKRTSSPQIKRQQCIVVLALPADVHESFPKVGDQCDLAFALEIPAKMQQNIDATQRMRNLKIPVHDIRSITARDNEGLRRLGVTYFKSVRVDNPDDKINLNGSHWSKHATFKVDVDRRIKSTMDYSPFAKFNSRLDTTTLATNHAYNSRPQITLDENESFEAHLWLDISDTTMSVELNALKKAASASAESRVGQAFSYTRSFPKSAESFNLFQVLPQMHDPDNPNSQLSDNLKELFRHLDEDQKKAWKTVLADLPCRVGVFPGGAGAGKTQLMLTVAALALARHSPLAESHSAATEQAPSSGGPILLIVEANQPCNAAATRVVEYFERLGRNDLLILRSYNFNYEGKWNSRKHLQVKDDDETSPEFDFDQYFPTHRADHIPQVRMRNRGDCRAQTLKEAAQQYLAQHPEDFPPLSNLLSMESDQIDWEDGSDNEYHRNAWYDLFRAVLAQADFVITTPSFSTMQLAQGNCLHLLLSRIFHLPRPGFYRDSRDDQAICRIAWEQETVEPVRRSTQNLHDREMPECHAGHPCNVVELSDLWKSADFGFRSFLVRSDSICSAKSERFPPSTMHLLEYCQNLALDHGLSIPRLLVHIKRSTRNERNVKSKSNDDHADWVIQRVVRDLVQDPKFRTTDDKEPGSILITTPYRAQFTIYRKKINELIRELDREHRAAGGLGKGQHREVLVEARTADTCQGHSADLVIFDLVGSEVTPHIDDGNRMCVALTRAKQAEIIVMQSQMLWGEGWGHGRLRLGGTYVDLLYEHCNAHARVISVEAVEKESWGKNYNLEPNGAKSRRDLSAVPRQLPPVPPSLCLPHGDGGQIYDSPSAVEPDLKSGEDASNGNDDGNPLSGEDFSFEMVKKALELGLGSFPGIRKDK